METGCDIRRFAYPVRGEIAEAARKFYSKMKIQPKIEKGISLPPRQGKPKTSVFRDMEVGDSVWMPVKQKAASGNYSYIAKTTERKFATRLESKDGTNGTRIWRIK